MIKVLLVGAIVLTAAFAFAENKGSLQVYDKITVNGKQLSPGDYALRWEGNGPEVELSIVKGRQVVATTPAHMVNSEKSADRDSAILKTNADGTKSLAEIRFSGKKYALAIGGPSQNSDMGASQ